MNVGEFRWFMLSPMWPPSTPGFGLQAVAQPGADGLDIPELNLRGLRKA
mgnify:CR=1 FL=1